MAIDWLPLAIEAVGQSIRSRFAWALTAFGAVITLVFAFVAIVAHENLEREVLLTAVRAEIAHVLEHVRETGVAKVETENLQAYLAPKGDVSIVPELFREYDVGHHDDITWRGREYFLTIQDLP